MKKKLFFTLMFVSTISIAKSITCDDFKGHWRGTYFNLRKTDNPQRAATYNGVNDDVFIIQGHVINKGEPFTLAGHCANSHLFFTLLNGPDKDLLNFKFSGEMYEMNPSNTMLEIYGAGQAEPYFMLRKCQNDCHVE